MGGVMASLPSGQTKDEWMQKVEDQLGLDAEETEPVIRLFFEEAETHIAKFDDICGKPEIPLEDVKKVVQISLSIKGTALMLRFDDLENSAAELEKNARSSVKDKMKQIEDFAALCGVMKASIQNWNAFVSR